MINADTSIAELIARPQVTWWRHRLIPLVLFWGTSCKKATHLLFTFDPTRFAPLEKRPCRHHIWLVFATPIFILSHFLVSLRFHLHRKEHIFNPVCEISLILMCACARNPPLRLCIGHFFIRMWVRLTVFLVRIHLRRHGMGYTMVSGTTEWSFRTSLCWVVLANLKSVWKFQLQSHSIVRLQNIKKIWKKYVCIFPSPCKTLKLWKLNFNVY